MRSQPRSAGSPEPARSLSRLRAASAHQSARRRGPLGSQLGLLALLEEQPDLDVAALATIADVAVAQARHEAVDVAVVDYELSERDGLRVTRKLKALARPPRVVVFCEFATADVAAGCAGAGADALLSRDNLGADVCYAIRAVSQGRRLIPASLTA